jgi:signal transduction histidine kinase
VQRASEITRQTLGFYRSSKIPGEVHIDELLDAVLTSKEKKITAKAIQVEKQRAEHMDPITGFPGEIRQVFDNLIENAIDALHYGGRLRVRSRPIL